MELKKKYEALKKIRDDRDKFDIIIKVLEHDLHENLVSSNHEYFVEILLNILNEYAAAEKDKDEERIVSVLGDLENELKRSISKDVVWMVSPECVKNERNRSVEIITNRVQPVLYTVYFKLEPSSDISYGLSIPRLSMISGDMLEAYNYGMFVLYRGCEWNFDKKIYQSYNIYDVIGFIKNLVKGVEI